MSKPFSLPKVERLSSKKAIDILFTKGDSLLVYPFRIAFSRVKKGETPVVMLASVSKKRFKRAVWRNAIKRKAREAYRLHKAELVGAVEASPYSLHVAFIYVGNEIKKFSYVEEKMIKGLNALREKLI